jgi:hypothetical protein
VTPGDDDEEPSLTGIRAQRRCSRRGTSTRLVDLTASFPLTQHQALKVGYARGACVHFGGNHKIASAAWPYSWIGKPR